LYKSSTSGNSSRAQIGQEAHRQIEAKLAKRGYGTEVPVYLPKSNQTVRKDAMKGKIVVIIKPNTTSGKRDGAKRAALMKSEGYKPYVWLYNPKNPKYLPTSSSYIGPNSKNCP